MEENKFPSNEENNAAPTGEETITTQEQAPTEEVPVVTNMPPVAPCGWAQQMPVGMPQNGQVPPPLYTEMQPIGRPKNNGLATASMTMGIISIVAVFISWFILGGVFAAICYTLGVLSIVFAVLSKKGQKKMSAFALAGMICGIVGMVLMTLLLLAVIALVVIMLFLASEKGDFSFFMANFY